MIHLTPTGRRWRATVTARGYRLSRTWPSRLEAELWAACLLIELGATLH